MRYLKYLIYIWIFLLISNCLALAQSVKIEDLINDSSRYDGKRVLVEGEAIGHLMKRGDFVWFNINDNTMSIGVWANSELAAKLQYLGKHAVTGDRVRIDGVFHSHCSMHGGDTDIHADSMVVVKRGSIRKLAHDPKKVNILIFLTGLMVCLYAIRILKKRR